MADKEQIGLTPAGSAVMDRVLATGLFGGKDDVARLAAALAIAGFGIGGCIGAGAGANAAGACGIDAMVRR